MTIRRFHVFFFIRNQEEIYIIKKLILHSINDIIFQLFKCDEEMKIEINKDYERGLETILKLKDAYFRNDFFNFTNVPDEIIPSGISRASKEHLLFLTFVSSIAYLRNEEQLWSAARLTWEDINTRYVFNPEEVLKTSREKVKKDLYKFNLFEDVIQARKWRIGNVMTSDSRRSRDNDIDLSLIHISEPTRPY